MLRLRATRCVASPLSPFGLLYFSDDDDDADDNRNKGDGCGAQKQQQQQQQQSCELVRVAHLLA